MLKKSLSRRETKRRLFVVALFLVVLSMSHCSCYVAVGVLPMMMWLFVSMLMLSLEVVFLAFVVAQRLIFLLVV